MSFCRVIPAFVLILANVPFLFAQGDEIEGPWGTANGDLAGTAATKGIPYVLGQGSVKVAWRLDVRTPGHDRPSGRNPITFDAAGNVYWKSSTGGGTGGVARVVSASPAGAIRWFGNDGAGGVHGLGAFDSTALNHLFLGLEPPRPPYPDCGEDPDGAPCDAHPCNV